MLRCLKTKLYELLSICIRTLPQIASKDKIDNKTKAECSKIEQDTASELDEEKEDQSVATHSSRPVKPLPQQLRIFFKCYGDENHPTSVIVGVLNETIVAEFLYEADDLL